LHESTITTPAVLESAKYLRCAHKATSTRQIITGTSISGPITAAKAVPLSIPKVATATHDRLDGPSATTSRDDSARAKMGDGLRTHE